MINTICFIVFGTLLLIPVVALGIAEIAEISLEDKEYKQHCERWDRIDKKIYLKIDKTKRS